VAEEEYESEGLEEYSEDFKVVLQDFLGKLIGDIDKFNDLLNLYFTFNLDVKVKRFERFLKFYISCLRAVFEEFVKSKI